MREAITSVEEDIDDHLMDWMLYYIYARSEHVDRMEYKVIITMLEDAMKKEHAQNKKRPESSSPDKIKQHNSGGPQMVRQAAAASSGSDSDQDRYSSDGDRDEDEGPIKPKSEDGVSDDYEDSPRVKLSDTDRKKQAAMESNGIDDEDAYPPEQSMDVDEDEMIDVAEKIFVRIADEIFKQKVTVR